MLHFFDILNYKDIEFEIKNIDSIPYANEKEITETLNYKGFLAPHNTPKTAISANQEMGTFLLEILNNLTSFKKIILCNYMKLSNQEREGWEKEYTKIKNEFEYNSTDYIDERNKLDKKIKDTCYSIFETLLNDFEKFNPKLVIFREWALGLMNEYYRNRYKSELENLRGLIRDYEHSPKPKTKLEMAYSQAKEELPVIDTIPYILQVLSESVLEFINDFENGRQLLDNAFIHSSETRNNKFSGTQSVLPTTTIEYKVDNFKFPTPFKYTYQLKNVEDFFNVMTYQLSLNHKVVIQCKNCGKYLIPARTDQIYCSENCKWRYMTRKSKENESETYSYYRKLYNRYKNGKTYEKEFEELKSIYYNQYKTKQIDDKTFMQLLLDFEQKVKSTHTTKRGRPKK